MTDHQRRPSIRKALVPVASLGTRFLPAAKPMPKELLPIIDKSIIQYAVGGAFADGMTVLIFATRRTKRASENHFYTNSGLERALNDNVRGEVPDMVCNIVPESVRSMFLRQPEALGFGCVVLCSEPAVGNEPFAVRLTDDVRRGALPTKNVVDAHERAPGTLLSVMEVAHEAAHKYGIVRLGTDAIVAAQWNNPHSAPNRCCLPQSGVISLNPRSWKFCARSLRVQGASSSLPMPQHSRPLRGRAQALAGG